MVGLPFRVYGGVVAARNMSLAAEHMRTECVRFFGWMSDGPNPWHSPRRANPVVVGS